MQILDLLLLIDIGHKMRHEMNLLGIVSLITIFKTLIVKFFDKILVDDIVS